MGGIRGQSARWHWILILWSFIGPGGTQDLVIPVDIDGSVIQCTDTIMTNE